MHLMVCARSYLLFFSWLEFFLLSYTDKELHKSLNIWNRFMNFILFLGCWSSHWNEWLFYFTNIVTFIRNAIFTLAGNTFQNKNVNVSSANGTPRKYFHFMSTSKKSIETHVKWGKILRNANLTLVNLLLKENIDDYDDEGQNTLSTANTLINEDKKV